MVSMRGKWLVAVAMAALVACTSDDDGLSGPSPSSQGGAGQGGEGGQAGSKGGDAGASVCVPGKSEACVGPGACQGGQVCKADGSGFGPCDCGAGGAGGSVGGAGGSAGGAGGASGAAGSAGKCEPLSAEKACSKGQCGTAPDGCGSVVECPACSPWSDACQAQASGISLCVQEHCKETDSFPDDLAFCLSDALPTKIECDVSTPNGKTPGERGCSFAVRIDDGRSYYCCPKPTGG